MNNPLRVIRVVEGTSVDGPGLRTSIYFAGCAHHCPECHNEHTWDFNAGEDRTIDELMETVRYNGFNVTFSGGDPLYQASRLIPFARMLKNEGYNIWCYTGFTFEELLENPTDGARELLGLVDVLVDGPYLKAQRNEEILFRGSSNQRIIDVKASLAAGYPVILTDDILRG